VLFNNETIPTAVFQPPEVLFERANFPTATEFVAETTLPIATVLLLSKKVDELTLAFMPINPEPFPTKDVAEIVPEV
jgi:hypothetical protein